jgi:predicted RNA-binding protein with PUA-like domain
MSYWLAKSDPDTYGWPEPVRDGKTTWDGIRNYKARNVLRAMKPGDIVLFYHSGDRCRPRVDAEEPRDPVQDLRPDGATCRS